jgi:hypothetical protein
MTGSRLMLRASAVGNRLPEFPEKPLAGDTWVARARRPMHSSRNMETGRRAGRAATSGRAVTSVTLDRPPRQQRLELREGQRLGRLARSAEGLCGQPAGCWPKRPAGSRRRPSGMFASLPGRVPQNLTGPGRPLVAKLRKEVGSAVELYAPYAGQAAEVLLDAIARGASRSGVISALFITRIRDGITGSFSILPSGDPSLGAITSPSPGRASSRSRSFTRDNAS